MSWYHHYSILIILGILFHPTSVMAQKTIVSGVVLDENNEPLAFVNIAFRHSTVGTITDINGNYFIVTSKATDSLAASTMGYGRVILPVQKYQEQRIDFKMKTISLEIEEVTVKPGENPAFPILRNINERKKFNNPDRLDSYQYRSYNKLNLDL
ncbi:carboxypeptidase-like regulatory domain-containing protein, partial [Bacteroidota bacterium]